MDIRILLGADAAVFQALRLEALQDSPTAFSSSYEEERDLAITRVAERLAPADDHAVFGAFDSTELVGTVGLQRLPARKLAHKAFIWGVYVTPRFRKRGIGRRLLQHALGHAATMPGLQQIQIGANAGNTAALTLYRSLGFEQFGVEPAFLLIDGVLYDEVHMTRVVARA